MFSCCKRNKQGSKPSQLLNKIIHDELLACYADFQRNKKPITSMEDLRIICKSYDKRCYSTDYHINGSILDFWDYMNDMPLNDAIDHLLARYKQKSFSPSVERVIQKKLHDHIDNILKKIIEHELSDKDLTRKIRSVLQAMNPEISESRTNLLGEESTFNRTSYCGLG